MKEFENDEDLSYIYNNNVQLLNELTGHQIQGSIIRSKTQWMGKGEKIMPIF